MKHIGAFSMAALLVATCTAHAQSFRVAPRYFVGYSPEFAASADLNGDGHADLVATTGSQVSVLLGNGQGQLGAPSFYGTSLNAVGIAVGEFNGDGRPDVVVPNGFGGDVAIFLGDGVGGLVAASRIGVGTQPTSIAIGDLNNDGESDIAVGLASDAIGVLLGNGSGGFSAALIVAVGAVPRSLVARDVNGDGNVDMVCGATGLFTGTVAVLLGDGTGAFAAATHFSVGEGPDSLVAQDFDGDGHVDLAVITDYQGVLTILRGDGSGAFEVTAVYPAGESPTSLAARDFDGDGDGDLAVVDFSSSSVLIFLGDGSGGFAPPRSWGASAEPSDLVAVDLDGNGRVDLITTDRFGGSVSVLLATGPASFAAARNHDAGSAPRRMARADFNGDGAPDLAVATAEYDGPGAWVLLGDGTGDFGPAAGYFVGGTSAASSLVSGDLNLDGQPDLAVTSGDAVFVLLGNGAGGFLPPVGYVTGTQAAAADVADFNGDSSPDLAVANGGAGDISILFGDGSGGFAPAVNYGVGPYLRGVMAGDFNQDGKQDLVACCSYAGDVFVLLGNGAGGFAAPSTYAANAYGGFMAAADLSGDGILDLAMPSSGGVSVLLGSGAGGFGPPTTYYLGYGGGQSVAVGDFDQDGNVDLAVATTADAVVLLLGNGSGSFTAAGTYGVGADPFAMVGGDLDGDGKPDLAVTGGYSGTVSILINTTPLLSIGDAAIGETDSGLTQAVLTVSVSPAPSRNVTVNYSTANGTATSGSDYVATSGTLTFPAGATSRTIVVPVFGDRVFEGDETFVVNLSGATNGTIADPQAAVTILDDDSAGFSVADATVAERRSSPATVTFTVRLSPTSGAQTSVDYMTADGTATATSGDYVTTSGTLTFPPSTPALPISVQVNSDALVEGAETFTLVLSNPQGGPAIAFSPGTATILDPQGGADFDGDGKTDILWRHGVSGRNVVWFMDGVTRTAGVYTNPDRLSDTNWKIAGTNDFNADGKVDILWRHGLSGKNVVWLMDGITRTAGVYTIPSALADTYWKIVGTGDFDTNGKPDLLWRHGSSGKNVVWTMDGVSRTGGVFTVPDALADTNWQMAGAGDFSGDGKADVLWRHGLSGKNVVWYMDGIYRTAGLFTNPDQLPDTNWQMSAVGDFNADDKPDVLFRQAISGRNVVWYMDGITRTGGVFTNPAQLADTNWRIVGPK